MRDGWIESGQIWSDYLNAWVATQGLHSVEQIRLGPDERFQCTVPALGRYYFPELTHTTASGEQAANDTGAIHAGATCYVGRIHIR